MKAIRTIILLAAVAMATALLSCTPEEPVIDFPDVNSVDIAAEGGSQRVSFSTNYDWEASASDSWIQVSPASGKKGNASVSISVAGNDTGKARKGNVTINSSTLKKTISVNQAANLTQRLIIKHNNESFTSPVFSGSGIMGMINWGDGSEEAVSASLNHVYSSSGSHTVTVKMNGGTGFELSSIIGITEIDVSGF